MKIKLYSHDLLLALCFVLTVFATCLIPELYANTEFLWQHGINLIAVFFILLLWVMLIVGVSHILKRGKK